MLEEKKLRAFAVGLAVHITGGLPQGPCGVDVIKPKSHQAKKLVQGHTVNEWQTQESNPRLTLLKQFPQQLRTMGQKRPGGQSGASSWGRHKMAFPETPPGTRARLTLISPQTEVPSVLSKSLHLILRTTKPPDVTYRSHGAEGAWLGKKTTPVGVWPRVLHGPMRRAARQVWWRR